MKRKITYDKKNQRINQEDRCEKCGETARLARHFDILSLHCRNCGKVEPMISPYSNKEVLKK